MVSNDARNIAFGLASVALLLTSGCAAESVAPEASLFGPWAWVESTGGIGGIRWSPDRVGRDLTIFFHRDGALTVYGGDLAQAHTRYRIAREHAGGDGDVVLHYDEPLSAFAFTPRIVSHRVDRLDADTLVLADPCCDRYRHTLVRIR